MSFTGLSSDEQGSIIYDGEKFIINNPSKVYDNFDPGDKPVVGLPETHPNHPNNHKPSSDMPPSNNPIFNKEKAIEHVERTRQERESARNKQSKPSDPVVPDDLPTETKPDIREKEVFDVCGEFCQQNPQAMTAVMNLIEGFDPDDDEQTLEERVSNHLRIMGLNDAFGHGDWYTTRLDPIVGSTATRIVDYYFDRVEASRTALLTASATDQESMLGEQQPSLEAPDKESRRLNYHALEHLRKYVDGWDDTWTTENEVSNFIIEKLADTYEIQVQEGFADLPIEDQLQEFLEFIYYHRESYYSRTWQYTSPYREVVLTADYNDFLPLLGLLNPAPLNDPHALAESFDFNSEAHAVDYLRHHVELVYAEKGYDLPENWSDFQDSVQLANMLYTVLEEIKVERESDETYDIEFGLDFKFHDAYSLRGSDVNRDFARLAGTHQLPDYSLFVFIVSWLWEPVDYAITIAEMGDDIARGDGLSALIRGAIGLLPGALGRLTKRFRSTDEMVDSFGWFDAADVNRGFPKHVLEEMMSGRATRPMSRRGHGKLDGVPEKASPRASQQMQDQIKAQNEVAELLADEGYHVVSLGPDHDNVFRTNMQKAINYQGTGNPDWILFHRSDDGTVVGREFDVYSPISINEGTIVKNIKDKVRDRKTKVYHQADRIVLNLKLTQGRVNRQALKSRLERENTYFLQEIIIVDRVEGNYQIIDIWTFNP